MGGGIAGLGAAYVLSRAHDVELYEREPLAGGHANTVVRDGVSIDTGFLVHNTPNYSLLCRLFRELGVRTHDSEMSFSVSCEDCGLEYSGRRPVAQARNAASPRFHALLWEIGRWLRTAPRSLEEADYESSSLGDYLDARGYSGRFRSHFLVPLTAALWSTAPGRALEFPAAYAIRFFENHGMLGLGRFHWRTVTGGSLGALARVSASASTLMIHEVEEIGLNYAETLRRWRESFNARIAEVRSLGYDARFERTWNFYLAYCEAGSRLGSLRDAQLTFIRSA